MTTVKSIEQEDGRHQGTDRLDGWVDQLEHLVFQRSLLAMGLENME